MKSGTFACNYEFVRGDCNADGQTDIADAVTMLLCKFSGHTCWCEDACNVNDDRSFDISDPVYLLNYQFSGGFPPKSPFPGCGTDPTPHNDPFPFCSRSACP